MSFARSIDDHLDEALSSSHGVREARQRFQEALRTVERAGAGGDIRQAILDLEEATNALAARCAETGLRVGLRHCRKPHGTSQGGRS